MTVEECNAMQDLIEKIEELIEIIEKKKKIRQAMQTAVWIVIAGLPGFPPPPTTDEELLDWWAAFLIWWNSEDRGCE